MKKIVVSIIAIVILIGITACSSEKIKGVSTSYVYNSEGDMSDFEYQIFLSGNEEELKSLSLSEVVFQEEIKNLILQSDPPEVELTSIGGKTAIVIIGGVKVDTKGMESEIIKNLKLVSSLKMISENKELVEIKFR